MTIEQLNKLYDKVEENQNITFYTKNENFTVVPSECTHISFYENYQELCDEWLNTGVPLNDKCYRNKNSLKQINIDKNNYYDYKKGLWFIVE